jgi:hypothetical protein
VNWPDDTGQAVFDLVVVLTWLGRELVWMLKLLRAREETATLRTERDSLKPGGLGAESPGSAAEITKPEKRKRDRPQL